MNVNFPRGITVHENTLIGGFSHPLDPAAAYSVGIHLFDDPAELPEVLFPGMGEGASGYKPSFEERLGRFSVFF